MDSECALLLFREVDVMQMRRNVLRNDIHNGILPMKGGVIMATKTANVIARVDFIHL